MDTPLGHRDRKPRGLAPHRVVRGRRVEVVVVRGESHTLIAPHQTSARFRISTVPADPSMRTRSPVCSFRVPVRVLITHGMPISRATMAPWLKAPPMSITQPPATRKYEA